MSDFTAGAENLRSIGRLFSLEGRVAVVTGGAEKLGASMTEALAEAGATVIITSRSLEKAGCAARHIARDEKMKVVPRSLDLRDEEAISRFFQSVQNEFGRLDILINNASGRGIKSGNTAYAYGRPDLQPLEDWQYTLYHNVTNAFLCCKHALPTMMEAKMGSIINISSVAALIGRDRWVYENSKAMIPNTSDYNAAKAALIGFTKDLAAQVGEHGIRVNAIAPGGFQSPTQPPAFVERYSSRTMLGRMGRVESDLKGAALFLASDASAYVTAHTLVVDGGFTQFC
jgi:NAD(P)-dependent dehydrogenase (short-subunit alcohol dehydrogenase family)